MSVTLNDKTKDKIIALLEQLLADQYDKEVEIDERN